MASAFAPNGNGAEMRAPVPGLRGVDIANAADVDGAVASRSRRHLQNKNSLWQYFFNGNKDGDFVLPEDAGYVKIWWGHEAGDAEWA
jgi:hypothetical protein